MNFDPTKMDSGSHLDSLEAHDEFISRHIGPADLDIETMLEQLGANSLEEFIKSTLPASIHVDEPLGLSSARSEIEVLSQLKQIAGRNHLMHNMIGMGYHETITPPVIQRNVLENPGWYTAYTPYQAEISQGRLEALLNFQQMLCDLTGMAIANASLLDEATAGAEAMTMLNRVNRKSGSSRFLLDQQSLPQTIDVISSRARYFGIDVVVADPQTAMEDGDFFAALIQYPGLNGQVEDFSDLIELAHSQNTLVAVAADLLSLAMLKPPGEMDADVVVGSSQRFGVPMGYGGPHAGYMATRDAYKRAIPGRIIGVSQDSAGRAALRMALQTREQHIRRDKATSNICTAQALLAVMSGLYAAYHGPSGLKKIAARVHRLCNLLVKGVGVSGIEPENTTWFDTVTFNLGEELAGDVIAQAHDAGINLRAAGAGRVSISVNEKTTRRHIETLIHILAPDSEITPLEVIDLSIDSTWSPVPGPLLRTSSFLEHPVFNRFHSETEMLRYLKRLENKDLSLAHAMISLGSCTMKLNATSEMIPVTWPEFSDIHPFAPLNQTQGYQQLFNELEQMLLACTGYDAVSLQPNAGSQGEYAGLLAIKSYHESRGEHGRNICLIPSSAHGTNPASAAMAGMKIIVVACDENGNVDVEDLQKRAEEHTEDLAALMITYPSTHGVFEERITEICDIIHRYGGQVYLDGANLNALVGCAEPGKFGADVSHLNLHKTFCIPHGGGGPGVGPICVGQHLAPFLPNHPVVEMPGPHGGNSAISAAPWGSAGILPISWAYIAMMGREGMKKATQVAILNANYIAMKLSDDYPVLYTGRNNRVAHECIIDLRPFKDLCGITEEDVAKRLIDYGFHAPTMSFPVPGTLMIEPTESESKAELERLISAMRAIRQEIRYVEEGVWDSDDNPLKNAPHTAQDIASDWHHPYSRQEAAYPSKLVTDYKFWPPVSRVDNVYGDRNLVCSCPPIEDWVD
jgi:glycine dehydrogenase